MFPQGTVLPVGEVARLDLERELRTGIPEVILAEGKRDEDLAAIARAMALGKGRAVVSRLAAERVQLLRASGVNVQFHEAARVAVLSAEGAAPKQKLGTVGILAAGSSDIPVCEEARVIAEEVGARTQVAYDVGVAGLHRLLPAIDEVRDADVLICAAGREGTMPTVVAGLTRQPVIGLPISTGYGMGGQGQAALLSMLQSCSPLLVVNIDAGFVAGACAARIAARIAEGRL
ncbi:MAG: nickel pincer cofactor biosynthesis protein LarB [Halobacteriales archaeon]|nr:nickel pincer cofactor biosynthesis protein LarB [Halobacteriales archaeon]